jgi:hypothetical protein
MAHRILLVEHHARHDVSPRRSGRCRILGHTIGSQLCHCHILLTHEVLLVLLCDLRHGLTRLCRGLEGKERQHLVSSTTPPYFLDLFLYLSFFSVIGKEAGRWWKILREDVGYEGATASFIAPRCNNLGGKATGLHRHGKKAQQKWAYASPDCLYDAPSTSWDTAIVSIMGPTIAVGSAKAQGLKAKPTSRVRATQSNQSKG